MKKIYQRHESVPTYIGYRRPVKLSDGRTVLVSHEEACANGAQTPEDLLRLAQEIAYDVDYRTYSEK